MSSRRFAESSSPKSLTPVTFPPGRLRLSTKPIRIGSPELTKTMGIVAVAALAANRAGPLPGTKMMLTWRRTRSRASSGKRLTSFCAARYSTRTFRSLS